MASQWDGSNAMASVKDGWKPIGGNPDEWNRILLGTDAHLYQYPYWNEPLRQIRLSPEYLVYTDGGEPRAYVCILRLGVPRMRIGVVRCGPVALKGSIPESALRDLGRWAKDAGFVFIRFSHRDESVLQQLAVDAPADRTDSLPFYPPVEHELLVEQFGDDEATAGRFQAVARRNIKDARKVDYTIAHTSDAHRLQETFPVFGALNERKGQVYSRPLASYVELLRHAAPHRGARVYTASLDGRIVQVLLIVRDRDTAHYVIGAMDVDALGDNTSPGCLLHWHAMRDFHREGARFYNLGLWGTGGLQVFKSKFRPSEQTYPPPLTLVLQPIGYRFWTRLLPWLRNSRPRIEKLIGVVRDLRQRAAL